MTNAFLHVGAAAIYGPPKLGRRAATQVCLTYLLYLLFTVRTPCQLPADGIISRPFAPARCTHPATGRPPLSPLSGAPPRGRGRRHAVEAGALGHLLAEGVHVLPAALRGRIFSRLRRAETVVEGRAEARRMGLCGVLWGVFGGVDVRCGKKKCDIFFFLINR